MNSPENRAAQVRDAVVEGYLETGAPLTVPDIAARLKWSETKVYRVMREAHGCVEGLDLMEDRRHSHSHNYQHHVTGSHKVTVYAPTLSTLRGMVRALRAKP